MDCGNRVAQGHVDEECPKDTEGTGKPPVEKVLDVSFAGQF